MPDRVAFVGLGNMGTPMSRRLLAAGHEVHGFDLSADALARLEEAGGVAHETAASAAAAADVVVLMLPNSTIVDATIVELRAAGALVDASVLIDMSSSDPIATRANAEALHADGIPFLDAPVSGGVRGAVAGSLTIMVGGEQAHLDRAADVLAPLGTAVRVGAVGAGHAAKALNNLVSATHLWATSEAVLAAEAFGIDRARFVEVLNGSTGASVSSDVKWPRFILPGTFDSGFSAGLLLKDVGIAVSLERRLGSPHGLSERVSERWAAAVADLGPGADHTEIARWLEQHPRD